MMDAERTHEAVVPTETVAPTEAAIPVVGRVRRAIFLGLGMLFIGLAILGAALPGIPITINVIIAGYFLTRSSPRFDAWLMSHKIFGPIIRDHRNGVGFSRRTKTIAISAMLTSMAISTWVLLRAGAPWFVAAIMGVIAVYATWFILHQPTKQVAR